MGQRYRLKPVAMMTICIPRLVPLRDFLRFRNTVDRGRCPVQSKSAAKAAEPLFRAGLSVGSDFVRQSRFFLLEL